MKINKDSNSGSSQPSRGIVDNALTEFRVAWLSGNRLDPVDFCKRYPGHSSELRARIQGFLSVVLNPPGSKKDKNPDILERKNTGYAGTKRDFKKDRSNDRKRVLKKISFTGLNSNKEPAGVAKPFDYKNLKKPGSEGAFIGSANKGDGSNGLGGSKNKIKAGGINEDEKSGGFSGMISDISQFLDSIADRGAPPLGYFRKATEIIAQAADALTHAHESGEVHGNLNCHKILLDSMSPRVTGFGSYIVRNAFDLSRDSDLSGDFEIEYFSPEQVFTPKKGVDKSTDIYSLGVVMYEMLTFKNPFKGKSEQDTFKKIVAANPIEPAKVNSRVPRALSLICIKALKKNPNSRYKSMEEFASDLQTFLAGETVQVQNEESIAQMLFNLAKRCTGLLELSGISLTTVMKKTGNAISSILLPIAWLTSAIKKRPSLSFIVGGILGCATLALCILIFNPSIFTGLENSDTLDKSDITTKSFSDQKVDDALKAQKKAENDLLMERQALLKSEGNRLVAHSERVVNTDPGLAMLLAMEGAKRNYDTSAETALYNALVECNERKTLRHEGHVTASSFSPEGNLLVSVSDDGVARIFDAASGEELSIFRNKTSGFMSATFSPDGRKLALGTQDGVTFIRDVQTGVITDTFEEHQKWAAVHTLTFSANGRWLITGAEDGVCCMWDLLTGADTPVVLKGHSDWASVHTIQFSHDDLYLLTAAQDNSAKMWDAESGARALSIQKFIGKVRSAKFSPSGKHILAIAEDSSVSIWDPNTGRPFASYKNDGAKITLAEFSPDGYTVALAVEDFSLRIWDLYSLKESHRFMEHKGLITAIRFSQDNKMVLTGSADGNGRIYDLSEGKLTSELKGHSGKVHLAEFSPNCKQVLTASNDQTVRIWNSTKGESLLPIRGKNSGSGKGVQLSALCDPQAIARQSAPRDFTYEERNYYGLLRPVDLQVKAIVDKYKARAVTSEKVIADHKNDVSISNTVLKKAIAIIKKSKINQLVEQGQRVKTAFATVMVPGNSKISYRRALHVAESALHNAIDPEDTGVLSLLGMAQYRLGAYSNALLNLISSDNVYNATFDERQPMYVAFIAMARSRLGFADLAMDDLQSYKTLLKDPRYCSNRGYVLLLMEAERLILNKKKAPAPSAIENKETKKEMRLRLKKLFSNSADETLKEIDSPEKLKKLINETVKEKIKEKKE